MTGAETFAQLPGASDDESDHSEAEVFLVARSDQEWSPQTAVDVVSHDDTGDPSGARAVEALIAQAEAILMARRQCARAQAYLLLSKAAQRNGLKVSELADLIVAHEKLR